MGKISIIGGSTAFPWLSPFSTLTAFSDLGYTDLQSVG